MGKKILATLGESLRRGRAMWEMLAERSEAFVLWKTERQLRTLKRTCHASRENVPLSGQMWHHKFKGPGADGTKNRFGDVACC